MLYIEDYSDQRNKAWCIHCRAAILSTEVNRDHVPSKSLLSKEMRLEGAMHDQRCDSPYGYLPQVLICKDCNSRFSSDESYLLSVLHAVLAGSLYPDPRTHPEAANVLRSNRHIVRSLKKSLSGQLFLFDNLKPFTLFPDSVRVNRVVVKNARGHAYYELGEPLMEDPTRVWWAPLTSMSSGDRAEFEETVSELGTWPEVGSRMTLRLVDGSWMPGGWIAVEEGVDRYMVDWSSGVTVRTVIWDYLATETQWS